MARKTEGVSLFERTCPACKRTCPAKEFDIQTINGMRIPYGDCILCRKYNFRLYMKRAGRNRLLRHEKIVYLLDRPNDKVEEDGD